MNALNKIWMAMSVNGKKVTKEHEALIETFAQPFRMGRFFNCAGSAIPRAVDLAEAVLFIRDGGSYDDEIKFPSGNVNTVSALLDNYGHHLDDLFVRMVEGETLPEDFDFYSEVR